ncbi:hypothetical protein GCM10027020_37630 [Nocardioides salsibiostraticola]
MNDDDLRARLRRIDPAADLPPLDPTGSNRLLEEIMTEQNEQPRSRTASSPSRLLLVAAAAAVVLIGVGGAFVLGGEDDPVVPTATDPVATPEQTPSEVPGGADVVVLSAPGETVGRCAVPNATTLGGVDVAFDGVVREIDDTAVVLDPTLVYAGSEVEEVRVESPAAALSPLIAAVDFQVGERYLVSAVDGRVTVCGFSGPYSPDLEQLYVDAFGG